MLFGKWNINENLQELTSFPQPLASVIEPALKNQVGTKLTPVLYCGEQLVNGHNYMLICKSKIVVPNATERLVEVVIHVNNDGSEYKILSIEDMF